MSRFCKAGLLSLTVNHRGPLPLRELHSTDETLAWKDLFTVMGEIITSESCHVSPTQELRVCILRRQCSPTRKNRTRKKEKHGSRTKYMKTALQIAKNGDTEDRKANDQA